MPIHRPTVDAIKTQLAHVDTAEGRRAIFMLWVRDLSVDRADILLALKELGLGDDFEPLAKGRGGSAA